MLFRSSLFNFVKETSNEELDKIFEQIELVDEDKKPTKKQIAHCLGMDSANMNVSCKSTEDWYCLLRNAQFGFELYKAGLKYMIDSQDFLDDGLFCEWGYVIDLANKTFNVYQGGKRRVASIPLEDIREMTEEDFISMAKGE